MTAVAGSPEAAAAIWDWRKPGPNARAARRSPGRTRILGVLQAFGLAVVSWVLFHYWSQSAAKVVLVLATIFLVTSLTSPNGLYAALLRLFGALGEATAKVVSWLLLGLVFYSFFLPFGLVFRRGHRDRLRRTLEPDAPSYWEPHAGLTAASASREAQY